MLIGVAVRLPADAANHMHYIQIDMECTLNLDAFVSRPEAAILLFQRARAMEVVTELKRVVAFFNVRKFLMQMD
mgnify:CR=1 FL=1